MPSFTNGVALVSLPKRTWLVSFSQNSKVAPGSACRWYRPSSSWSACTTGWSAGTVAAVVAWWRRRPAFRPGVAEPEGGQHVERGVGATVVDGDAAQDVVRAVLRVLDLDVEVAVVVEDPGVDQFVLRLEPAA